MEIAAPFVGLHLGCNQLLAAHEQNRETSTSRLAEVGMESHVLHSMDELISSRYIEPTRSVVVLMHSPIPKAILIEDSQNHICFLPDCVFVSLCRR